MTVIATIPKNSKQEIRVSLDHFQGHDLLNMRVWYRTDQGEMRPGKQGLAVRLAILPDLIHALIQAEQAALKGDAPPKEVA